MMGCEMLKEQQGYIIPILVHVAEVIEKLRVVTIGSLSMRDESQAFILVSVSTHFGNNVINRLPIRFFILTSLLLCIKRT
jgi:hypothetical protein